MACWEGGDDEPWFVLTDLAPERAESLWSGMRAWIEQGFKRLKSAGWQWPATRMTDCGGAERWWLVLAVATRDVLAVGGEFEADPEVPVETLPEMTPAVAQGGTTGNPPSPTSRGGSVAKPGPAAGVRATCASAPRHGAEGAAGQRVPPRTFGVARTSDGGSSVARTSMETRTVVGIPAEIKPCAGQPPTPIPKNPSL